MDSYRTNLPQASDPLEFLYKLERDLEMSEQKTASLVADLSKRLDLLETRVSSISERLDLSNRQLEMEVMALADRLNALETS